MIEPKLIELGLNKNEIKAYLYLAESQGSSAHILAKRIKIPRTTAYSVLASLIDKGLVSEEQRKGVAFFIPNRPQSLARLLRRQQEELKSKEIIVKDLAEYLHPFFQKAGDQLPKMRLFEGRENVENMLYDHLDDWRQSMGQTDNTWWGYQDVDFVKQYRRWLEHYWKHKSEVEQIKLLSNQDPVESDLATKVAGRFIKAVPKETKFSSTIWVMGDYIVLLMTKANPHYAFQLKDPLFAANLRMVYQMLWVSI